MADKPSRGLVLYGYGLASLITPSHSHIHAVASRGCCGFLALDHSSPNPGYSTNCHFLVTSFRITASITDYPDTKFGLFLSFIV